MATLFQKVKTRINAEIERRTPRRKTVVLNRKVLGIFPSSKGIAYLITLITLFIGGINYSNSLMLAVCFLLSSLFIVTILHTFRNISGLEISVGRSENAFAKEKALFTVHIKNKNDRPYENLRLYWEGESSQAINLIDTSQVSVEMMIPCDKRGEFKPGRLRLQTYFPLGVITSWAWFKLDTSCLVYPMPIANEATPIGLNKAEEHGQQTIPNGVDDFAMLKAYQPGDSLKHVDWKAFAKTDDLYTKSFVDYADEHTWLDWDDMPSSDTEVKLSYLCYWILKLSEKGKAFGLRLPGQPIQPNLGERHKLQCLQALACY